MGLLLLIHLYLFAQLTFLKRLPKTGKEDRQQIRKHPYHTLHLNKDLLFSSQENNRKLGQHYILQPTFNL